MRYCIARYSQDAREMIYKRYITDSLLYLTGGTKMHYVVPFIDILYPPEVETRTGEEMVEDIANKAGIIIK